MSARHAFLAWLGVGCAAACSIEGVDEAASPPSPVCEDECAVAGDARCDGEVLASCVADADGCLRWQPEDCAAGGGVCRNVGGEAECLRCDRGAWPYDYEYIVTLEGLAGYTAVNGDLDITTAPIASLAGLECLEHIGGDLVISSNDTLESLNGLGGLRSIAGNLNIGQVVYSSGGKSDGPVLPKYAGNPALTTLDDLDALEVVGGDSTIVGNPVLPTCQATRLAERLQKSATIEGNDDEGVCD